jgi:uncharacterized protein
VPLRHVGVEIFDHDECLRLLATAPVGRLGFTSGALPLILPVAFTVLDGDIVFRTGSGTKLEAALRRQVACFEADEFDPAHERGWSVIVTGTTEIVTDQALLDRVAAAPLAQWAGEREEDRIVRLKVDLVSGRWLSAPQHAAAC